jgi:hypothetical protein
MASMDESKRTEIYKTGLHSTEFLYSLAEVMIGWLLLRQAEVAQDALDAGALRQGPDFYTGKVASARWFARNVLPKVALRAPRRRRGGRLADGPSRPSRLLSPTPPDVPLGPPTRRGPPAATSRPAPATGHRPLPRPSGGRPPVPWPVGPSTASPALRWSATPVAPRPRPAPARSARPRPAQAPRRPTAWWSRWWRCCWSSRPAARRGRAAGLLPRLLRVPLPDDIDARSSVVSTSTARRSAGSRQRARPRGRRRSTSCPSTCRRP